jgi:uncharacterized protein (DUF2147 family)
MIASLLAFALASAAPAANTVVGTWSNPRGTVTVQTARCGRAICGKVVAATPEAREKARAAGNGELVGTEILHQFRATGPGRWEGEAFIPDLGLTVTAAMTQLGRDQLQIEGCAFGGYACKSQVWHRVAARATRR